MSKIQVDAIEQQTACGTTLTAGGGAGKTVVVDATTVTLGRCGGTVALASGATQTGFGRTGTVDWNTTPKTTGTFTAVSGDGFFLNTSGGVITANLPAGVAGAIVSFADYAGTWQTNAVTVTPNGTDKIGALNQNATLNVEGQSVTFVFVDSTQGWINTMDSTSNVRGNIPFPQATVSGSGNTLVTAPDCANAKIATFTGPGTFCVSSVGGCAANNVVSYVVVAGGGGGGSWGGGGAGAGGYREVKSPTTPYTASPLDGYSTPANRITLTASSFPITVGAGGTAPPSYPTRACGSNGSNSIFSTITAAGGGRGGNENNPAQPNTNGAPGGSGGGSGNGGSGGVGNTPPTTPAQGFSGGAGNTGAGAGYFGGGGGGASAVGGTAGPPNDGGPGGAGVTSSISSSPVARAGGGGGGNVDTGCTTGGAGGGGAGGGGDSGGNGVAGTVNTGGGGGAAGASSPSGASTGTAGLGGSGIVIIRYRFQ